MKLNKVASLSKVLPVTNRPVPSDPDAEEKRQFQQSEKDFKAKMDEIRSKDKISEPLEYAPYATNQTPAQVWGFKLQAADDTYRFRFSRWYFGIPGGVIVDLFKTQKEYDAANVEKRREIAHKYGSRYAALGPRHSRYPLNDVKLRKLYPSMVEQLEQK